MADHQPSGGVSFGSGKFHWAVFRLYHFNDITAQGHRLTTKKGDPASYLAVFDNEADAIAWSGGSEHVKKVEEFV